MDRIPNWPRSPDPRKPLEGARGFSNSAALAHKYGLYCLTPNLSNVPELQYGVVVPKISSTYDDTAYFYAVPALGFPFYDLHIKHYQDPVAALNGFSIQIEITLTFGFAQFAFGTQVLLWPSGGKTFSSGILLTEVNLPANFIGGTVFFNPCAWDRPDGFVQPSDPPIFP